MAGPFKIECESYKIATGGPQTTVPETERKLIGWWKLDEAEGSSASDSSGNNHTGTLVGNPQWQPSDGKIGGAMLFDGNGDYVNLGEKSDFDITNQITVATWIKPMSKGSLKSRLFPLSTNTE